MVRIRLKRKQQASLMFVLTQKWMPYRRCLQCRYEGHQKLCLLFIMMHIPILFGLYFC